MAKKTFISFVVVCSCSVLLFAGCGMQEPDAQSDEVSTSFDRPVAGDGSHIPPYTQSPFTADSAAEEMADGGVAADDSAGEEESASPEDEGANVDGGAEPAVDEEPAVQDAPTSQGEPVVTDDAPVVAEDEGALDDVPSVEEDTVDGGVPAIEEDPADDGTVVAEGETPDGGQPSVVEDPATEENTLVTPALSASVGDGTCTLHFGARYIQDEDSGEVRGGEMPGMSWGVGPTIEDLDGDADDLEWTIDADAAVPGTYVLTYVGDSGYWGDYGKDAGAISSMPEDDRAFIACDWWDADAEENIGGGGCNLRVRVIVETNDDGSKDCAFAPAGNMRNYTGG